MENEMNKQEVIVERMVSVKDALALAGVSVLATTLICLKVNKKHLNIIKKQRKLITKLADAGMTEFVRANTLKEVVDSCMDRLDTIKK